jgi:hypothetical protein
LGVRGRIVTANWSPNGLFSPKLGTWPIYSTSFFASDFSSLVSFPNRKVGIPFPCGRGDSFFQSGRHAPRPPRFEAGRLQCSTLPELRRL